MNVGGLASGSGTNLQALMDRGGKVATMEGIPGTSF